MKKYNFKNRFLRNLLILALSGYLVTSCNNSTKEEKPAHEEEQLLKNETTEDKKKEDNYCFRNQFPFADNSGDMDIEELLLKITANKVTGTYSWLPAYKDQRKGTIEGVITDNVITGSYTFTQEGISNTATIKIAISAKEAIIEGQPAEHGLAATIAKIDCDG